MKRLSTRTHGILDYIVGVVLILAPFVFDFANDGPEMWVPIALGAATILYSLFTAYEMGLVRAIPMPGHLTLDFLSGVLLAASPWLFGFSGLVWAPHLIVGLFEIIVAFMTQRSPATVPVHHRVPQP